MWNKIQRMYVGSNQVRPTYYEYNYDFRNKTSAQFTADGWTAYEWTANFNSDGIYGSSWTLRTKKTLPFSLDKAKKITIIENYKWTWSSAWTRAWIANVSDMTHWNWFYIQGTARGTDLNSTFNQTTNSASSSTWTFKETLVLDLVDKTYQASGHWSYSTTLTDAVISSIKNNTWIYVMLYNSSYIRVQDVSILVVW